MLQMAIVLTSLTGTNLLVAAALAIAWRRFGREPHAALWAAGFLASGAGHAAQLVKSVSPSAAPVAVVVAIACLTASMTLLALGFRRRAGQIAGARAIVAVAICAAAITAALSLGSSDHRAARMAINLFACAMLILSARAVRSRGSDARTSSEPAFWMLSGFAAFCAILVAVASQVSTTGAVTEDLYRFLFLVGVPSGMTGIGLGALLLLGGDLADRLNRLAEIDPLTGILNRRGIVRAATRLIAQAQRGNRPLSVVVADLDRFKAINDRHGHMLGDVVLKRFAGHASGQVRGGDLVGRLGGEEFVFVLSDTGPLQASEGIDRLRAGLAAALQDLHVPITLTASFGIAALGDHADSFEALLARADDALYQSKDAGRDRISVAPPQHASVADPRFRSTWLREAASFATGRAGAGRHRGGRAG